MTRLIILMIAFGLTGCSGMTVQWPASCVNLNASGVSGCMPTLPPAVTVLPGQFMVPNVLGGMK